jgi:hypothetical protein
MVRYKKDVMMALKDIFTSISKFDIIITLPFHTRAFEFDFNIESVPLLVLVGTLAISAVEHGHINITTIVPEIPEPSH